MANDVGANAPGAAFGARRTEGAPAAVAFGTFVAYGPVAQKLDLNLHVATLATCVGGQRAPYRFTVRITLGIPQNSSSCGPVTDFLVLTVSVFVIHLAPPSGRTKI